MGAFTSLAESTSPIAQEIFTLIKIHPAYSYIRTSYLYDHMYDRFKAQTENTSEARLRTVLHITHILDEIAHSMGLIDSNLHYSIPEHIFTDAFSNPKYKAGSHLVTHESRLRQQQRMRAKFNEAIENAKEAADMTTVATTASKKESSINAEIKAAINDKFNSLLFNLVHPCKP